MEDSDCNATRRKPYRFPPSSQYKALRKAVAILGKHVDLTGRRFGRLVVLSPSKTRKYRQACWVCQCDCGTIKEFPTESLKKGASKSCGCLQKERASTTKKKHGQCDSRLYSIWANMIGRCSRPTSTGYENYGGRGIKVCDEWHNFQSFMQWAEQSGYDPALKFVECSLDRIDANKDYSPDNCRWVDWDTQQNNRRDTKKILFRGEQKTLAQLAKEYGVSSSTLRYRIKAGWSLEEALTKPIQGGKLNEQVLGA